MSSYAAVQSTGELLTFKGLACAGALVSLARTVPKLGFSPNAVEGALKKIARDEGVIRDVFNRRYRDIDALDLTDREFQLQKRSTLLRLVYDLYLVGCAQIPLDARRALQASEVETILSAVQRISITAAVSYPALLQHCCEQAAAESEVLPNVMDPLQLRFVLSFHSQQTREIAQSFDLAALRDVCMRHDREAMRRWFETLHASVESLPRDLPQFLRALLLEFWRYGEGDLGMLAHEIAVVDVRLYEDLGWETTRAFCAQLRRMTGPGAEALDAFLTDEDIDSALVVAEELRQADLIAHFRKLASTYNTTLQRDVARSVATVAARFRSGELPAQERVKPREMIPDRTTSSRSRVGVIRGLIWSPFLS
jgi:hypothetical protein